MTPLQVLSNRRDWISFPCWDRAPHEIDAPPDVLRPIFRLAKPAVAKVSRPQRPRVPAASRILDVEAIDIEIINACRTVYIMECRTLAQGRTEKTPLMR